ncbi:conserved hypothetical protein [Nitrospina gracilis 3/211]|uniref:AB hydrolase-1 domain-containing protein n=1 Tax=Nitrospina gracilis (strain 3/211) TaxID=1266370 RepID=M1YM42_NITG3|nr:MULTISPECIES: alpha/beta hydrolase [Nitrospina]MCF8724402.1 hypothetical protein [Nitrospina sp. Nb-3]CCQ91558.1 conserved hypothetical protein [Nitrospina gracilis 3/211]
MPNGLTITLICGWAIPEDWLKELAQPFCPEATVHGVYPRDPFDAEEAKRILQTPAPDIVIGYSLGSLWLLHHREHLPEAAVKILMAPILAFKQEAGLSGKIPSAQLEFFLRTVERTPDLPTVLGDFMALGDIVLPPEAKNDIPERDTLLRGLQFLRDVTVSPDATAGFHAVLGDRDPFTDATALQPLVPSLEVVHDCGHHPEPLLQTIFQLAAVQERLAASSGKRI